MEDPTLLLPPIERRNDATPTKGVCLPCPDRSIDPSASKAYEMTPEANSNVAADNPNPHCVPTKLEIKTARTAKVLVHGIGVTETVKIP